MKDPYRNQRTTRRERIARAAAGMPERHAELLTRRPSRVGWRQLAAWIAQPWPGEEYTAIVTGDWWQDPAVTERQVSDDRRDCTAPGSTTITASWPAWCWIRSTR